MNNEQYIKRCYELAINAGKKGHDTFGALLEDEGMHVFEYWGGEYHTLEELIAEMDEVKRSQAQGAS